MSPLARSLIPRSSFHAKKDLRVLRYVAFVLSASSASARKRSSSSSTSALRIAGLAGCCGVVMSWFCVSLPFFDSVCTFSTTWVCIYV